MMENYVDVAERIRQFKKAFPTGCLRPFNPAEPFKIQEIGGREFIVYVAAAYRTPDDLMPAIAVAAEPAVGKTSFTRDSEVMNAETSAWGRAIVAALAADTQKIASLDEVRNRQSEQAVVSPNHPAGQGKVVEMKPRSVAVVEPDFSAMAQSIKVVPANSTDDGITIKQTSMMQKVARERGLEGSELFELIEAVTSIKVESIAQLSKANASKVIKYLMDMVN